MKRIALLLACGALVASAQEVRISRAVLLRSERSMISLGAGTIVDLLSCTGQCLKVRFNGYTGVIPANSLTPPEKQPAEVKAKVETKHSESQDPRTVNRTKEDGASSAQNAAQVKGALAAN